jgi:hypothetical protein
MTEIDSNVTKAKILYNAYRNGASDLILGKIIAQEKPEDKQLLLGQEFVKMLKERAVERNIDLPER